MSVTAIQDLVWNRACFASLGDLRAGDAALSALLAFHGLAMNGGVLHATELLSDEKLLAAQDGFKHFGFHVVAALIAEATGAMASGEELDDLEQELNERYWSAIPEDSALTLAFEADFAAHPENYAPVQ